MRLAASRCYHASQVFLHPIAHVRIDGIKWVLDYWLSTHRLCVPGDGCKVYTWPLLIYARPHAEYPNRIWQMGIRPFVNRAVATGLIPRSDYWLSSRRRRLNCSPVHAGSTGTATVTGVTLPTISEPGGSSCQASPPVRHRLGLLRCSLHLPRRVLVLAYLARYRPRPARRAARLR